MQRTRKRGLILGAVAALLWSPHFALVQSMLRGGTSLLVAEFYFLLFASVLLLLLLFLSGRLSELSVFKRRETHFLALAASGGYGLALLLGLALGQAPAAPVRLWFYAGPLIVALLSLFGRERADLKAFVGILLGFFGCVLVVRAEAPGSLAISMRAIGAAACWAVFSMLARPLVREEKPLPVAAVVCMIGAACLLVTCLSMGRSVFAVRPAHLWTAAVTGAFTVGLMMVFWLKCLGSAEAALAAPLWYLGLAFGVVWVRRVGVDVDGWLAFGGIVLVLFGLHTAFSGRRSSAMSLGDVIRG